MTDILKKIENNLGKIVEGIFDHTFNAPLHPVEIAKKITATIDNNITIDGSKKIAANHITVVMPEDVYDRIIKNAPEIIDQLKLYVRTHVDNQKYSLFGTLHIEITQGARLLVSAENVADKINLHSEGAVAKKPESLIITDLENKTESHIDLTEEITIGRSLDSAIVISNPAASRNHADIREIDGYYVLRDLNSSNGTMLNGKKITASRLKAGDEIMVAKTTIKVI